MSKAFLSIATWVFVLGVLSLTACGSNAVKNQYYTLSSPQTGEPIALNFDGALGVGPVKLPEFLDSPSIVALAEGQKIQTSVSHLWAGDVKQAITRVLVDTISTRTQKNDVWGFPWDVRTRPENQVSIFIDQAQGQLGGDFSLKARWKILTNKGKDVNCVRSFSVVKATSNKSYSAYVNAMNLSIIELAEQVAVSLDCQQ